MDHDSRATMTEKKLRKVNLNKMTDIKRPQSKSKMLPSIRDSKFTEFTTSTKDNDSMTYRGTNKLKESITTLVISLTSTNQKAKDMSESMIDDTASYLNNRLKELEKLKEKEYQYFKNNFTEYLDKKIEQLKADIEYEKNRSRALTTEESSMSITKRTNVEKNSDDENRASQILIAEIYYSKKNMDSLNGRNNDLKAKMQSLKFKEQLRVRKTSKNNENEPLPKIQPKENLKANKLKRDIEALNEGINSISNKAMDREVTKAHELKELNSRIGVLENYLSRRCDCLTHMLAYKTLPLDKGCECVPRLRNICAEMLQEKNLVIPMFLKKRIELIRKICSDMPKTSRPQSGMKKKVSISLGHEKSQVNDMTGSIVKIDNIEDKKSLFFKHKTDSEGQSKSNSSYIITNTDKTVKDLVSSTINLSFKNKDYRSKTKHGKTQSADHENTDKNETIEKYKKRFQQSRPLTTNFVNNENLTVKPSSDKKKRESFLTAMINKNISDLSFFNNIINNNNPKILKPSKTSRTFRVNMPAKLVALTFDEKNLSDDRINEMNKSSDSNNEPTQKRQKGSTDSEVAYKRAITSKYSSNTGSVKSKFFQDYSANSFNKAKTSRFLKNSATKPPSPNSRDMADMVDRKPTFSNSNEGSEKFVVGNEMLRNQWLYAKSIQSFTSKVMKDQSVDIRNEDDNRTVFTNFIQE